MRNVVNSPLINNKNSTHELKKRSNSDYQINVENTKQTNINRSFNIKPLILNNSPPNLITGNFFNIDPNFVSNPQTPNSEINNFIIKEPTTKTADVSVFSLSNKKWDDVISKKKDESKSGAETPGWG